MQRTQQQWQVLIQRQRESEGSIKDFCLEQGLSTSSFYKHKASVLMDAETIASSPFSPVVCVEPLVPTPAHLMSLSIGKVTITFDSHMDAHWLASFVGQLA